MHHPNLGGAGAAAVPRNLPLPEPWLARQVEQDARTRMPHFPRSTIRNETQDHGEENAKQMVKQLRRILRKSSTSWSPLVRQLIAWFFDLVLRASRFLCKIKPVLPLRRSQRSWRTKPTLTPMPMPIQIPTVPYRQTMKRFSPVLPIRPSSEKSGFIYGSP